MWFEKLVGFKEESPAQVRRLLEYKDGFIRSKANGRIYQSGQLDVLSLGELRRAAALPNALPKGGEKKLKLYELVADVQALHEAPENVGALFQSASQFNLLEMLNPNISPEDGIGIYEFDRTQGPACAIACGAGTIYRNYFMPVNGQIGQSKNVQIDCAAGLHAFLGGDIWEMRNGYALATKSALLAAASRINNFSPAQRQAAKDSLQIGLQWDTAVTLGDSQQLLAQALVSQAYCSAMPIAYNTATAEDWQPLARLVLEASYEATFYAAKRNFERGGCNKLFLTLVGGGAFGNPQNWVFDAILQAARQFEACPLSVAVVSYGRSNPDLRQFCNNF
jgi:hypothetical protein